MKICVIGGTGHIARFLVPMLVRDGHKVIVVSSGRKLLPEQGEWAKVEHQICPYKRADGDWQCFIRGLGTEVIIDLLGLDLPSTYKAGKGSCKQLIACGSLWMLGVPKQLPTPEVTQGPCYFSGYAQRYEEIQKIMAETQIDGIAFSAIFPPNISGPGKIPLEVRGGRDIEVHRQMVRGETVILPQYCNTAIGPCDAEDIAQAFWLAVGQSQRAAGKIFNVGASYALTAIEFVETYSAIYGVKLPIEFVDPDEFYTKIVPNLGGNYHFRTHMLPDISRLTETLGYSPKYTPEESLERAVLWMKSEGVL